MMYDDIERVNKTIKTTDIKGKDYAEVNQRIKAFRMLYPQGVIETEMISNEDGICIFKATIGYRENGELYRLATGTAYEKENSTFINKTSYIENCETSAVGRALGMCGFGIDTSVASYEEVQNAMNNQVEMTEDEAKEYVLEFGKYKGMKLADVNDQSYINWLLYNERTSPVIVRALELLGYERKSNEEMERQLNLMVEVKRLIRETETDYEEFLNHYKVKSDGDLTMEQLEDAKKILEKKLEKNNE